MSLRRLGRRRWGREFRSTEEYFESVRVLVERLRTEGHVRAADELLEGFRCLNGLTDGWALFLEAADKVWAEWGKDLGAQERDDLKNIRAAAYEAVYRRRI